MLFREYCTMQSCYSNIKCDLLQSDDDDDDSDDDDNDDDNDDDKDDNDNDNPFEVDNGCYGVDKR